MIWKSGDLPRPCGATLVERGAVNDVGAALQCQRQTASFHEHATHGLRQTRRLAASHLLAVEPRCVCLSLSLSLLRA
jgi:hypothetical protein